MLALSAALLLGGRLLVVAAGLAALLLVPPGAVKARAARYEAESRYQFIQVVERPDRPALLYLNEGVAVHSLWRPDTVLTGGVWDAFLAVPLLLDRPPARSPCSATRAGRSRGRSASSGRRSRSTASRSTRTSDGGRRCFGMGDNPRLTDHDADARPFLRRRRRYDLIYVDAYHQPYVPFYLATREFFQLVRERLEPGGIVALNVARCPATAGSTRARGRSRTSSLRVRVWPALRFNHVVIAVDGVDLRPGSTAAGRPLVGCCASCSRAGPAVRWGERRGPTTVRPSSG